METKDNSYPNADEAFRRFTQLLNQLGFKAKRIPKNNFRHSLITTNDIDFYCLYRDDDSQHGTFETFNNFFDKFVDEFPEFRGHAESINEDILDEITSRYDPIDGKKIVLVFIYKDTKKYVCNPFLFKKFSEKHNLKRIHQAGDIKKKLNGEHEQIFETTSHLPFKEPFFINFDKWKNENITDLTIVK